LSAIKYGDIRCFLIDLLDERRRNCAEIDWTEEVMQLLSFAGDNEQCIFKSMDPLHIKVRTT
jgi:hypothetical protein